jgi:hypothetical protein
MKTRKLKRKRRRKMRMKTRSPMTRTTMESAKRNAADDPPLPSRSASPVRAIS